MRKRLMTMGWVGAATLLLAACGGGGSDSAAAGATTGSGTTGTTGTTGTGTAGAASFPAQAGISAVVAAGATHRFVVTGSCSGSASSASSAATPVAFEGVSGYASVQTSTVALNGCTSPPAATGTYFYDARYAPVGLAVDGGDYLVFSSAPQPLPDVKVGDFGVYALMTAYADNSRRVVTGHTSINYVVEPDATSATAVFNLIWRAYDASGNLATTWQTRYRMAANGRMTLLTIDLQNNQAGSNAHLVYTKV